MLLMQILIEKQTFLLKHVLVEKGDNTVNVK